MTDDLFAVEPQIFSVTELTRRVRDLLEGGIGETWVQGEISNYRRQSSGHQYFTLKDDRAQLACVLFARQAGVRMQLSDGMAVQVFGGITVYEARGQYQMIVRMVQPLGLGALQAKFEALKRKLDAEGLFDRERKRPLPKFPTRIGVVTSPTGAALQDMLHILERRAPWLRLLIYPVRVQGDGAAEEIAAAVRDFSTTHANDLDLVIIARGGGSIEDLWAFNEEIVARAIAESLLPIVSAVGHEIDFTIADFVADLRAPTPSAAAEIVAPDGEELARYLESAAARLKYGLGNAVERERERLTMRLAPALQREPARTLAQMRQDADVLGEMLDRLTAGGIDEKRQKLTDLAGWLRQHRPDYALALRREAFGQQVRHFEDAASRVLRETRERLARASGVLRVLGPVATLERGYTITSRENGTVILSAREVGTGEKLRTRFYDGEVISET
ncbi:MAG TPA: exodeoxyribonuclease VII large subunit [Chthoniobacterales bacterium]